MTEIDPGGLQRRSSEQSLYMARSKAIQAYAGLEQCLCLLFAQLLETRVDLAGIAFFKLTNTRARNRILEDLMKKRCGPESKPWRSSFIKRVGTIDQRRNEIVHWQVSINVAPPTVECRLIPHVYWDMTEASPHHNPTTLTAFKDECDFLSRSVNMFVMATLGSHQFAARETWLQIFREEVAYPPPHNHPLCRTPKEP